MAELKRKICVRKGHISHLKRVITEFENLRTEPNPDKTKLKTLKLTVLSKQSIVSNMSDEIWALMDEESSIEKDMDDINNFMDSINYVVTCIEELTEKVMATDTTDSALSTTSTTESRIKLPKIDTTLSCRGVVSNYQKLS